MPVTHLTLTSVTRGSVCANDLGDVVAVTPGTYRVGHQDDEYVYIDAGPEDLRPEHPNAVDFFVAIHRDDLSDPTNFP
jgi:hypothetical protein